MRRAFASVLLTLLPIAASAAPLFDAQIKAERTDAGIEVRAFIANHSRRSACYALVTPDITMNYRDGDSRLMVSTNERIWQFGSPPPWPVQVVPADGKTYAYPWITLPPDSAGPNANAMISVEAKVELYGCAPFFSTQKLQSKKIFEATLTGAVEP